MGDLSPHFSTHEFATRDGSAHPDPLARGRLVAHLESLRCLADGRPLTILSGHRSVNDNVRVGGATASRHLNGDAADIPYGYATVAQAEAAGFTGIGIKGRYAVHVDLRPTPAKWHYT